MRRLAVCRGVFAAAIVGAAGCRTGDFTIAERGVAPVCAIVVGERPNEATAYAAKELQAYVAKLTDVRLAVTNRCEGPRVELCRLSDGTMAQDAFRLEAGADALKVSAASDAGLLYGVYEVLERFGGVRWYASWCEKVPRLDRLTVPGGFADEQEPAFRLREAFWFDILEQPDFAARLRVNEPLTNLRAKHGGKPVRFGGGLRNCHSFYALVPPATYFKDHPEYFAEVDGKRIGAAGQLCLSNPDVFRIVVSNLVERIDRDPHAPIYNVSQQDCAGWCTCAKCRAVDEEEGSPSGSIIRFVNRVAEEVEKRHPDAIIATLAYKYSRKPPKKARPRHNVMIELCLPECEFSKPLVGNAYPFNAAFLEDLRAWSAITPKYLYIWDYNANFYQYACPYPNVRTIGPNIRFFRDCGVKYLFEEGSYTSSCSDFAELKAYLQAKWMWNPDLPEEGLLDDFFGGFYGKGAPFVRAYFDELHRFYDNPAEKPLLIEVCADAGVVPDAFLARAEALFEKAEAAVKDEPEAIRANVRFAKFPVIYARYMALGGQFGYAAFATRHPERVKDAFARKKRYATWMLERMAEKDSPYTRYFVLSEEPVFCNRFKAQLEKWAKEPLPSAPSAADAATVEDDRLYVELWPKWAKQSDDPLAANGKALRIANDHWAWAAKYFFNGVATDEGATYSVSARVRAEVRSGVRPDEKVFAIGVYDPDTRKEVFHRDFTAGEFADGKYRDLKLLDWVSRPGAVHLYVQVAEFDRKDGKVTESPVHNGIFIDSLTFTRAR